MSSWAELAAAEPDFAERVRRVLEARKHKSLATLRRDGSPRVSGVEVQVTDGELVMGMMPGSRKVADLERDPRLAIHTISDDPPAAAPGEWGGDVQVAGRAIGLERPDGPPHYRIHLAEIVLTRLGDPADHLLIESWHPGRGLVAFKRY